MITAKELLPGVKLTRGAETLEVQELVKEGLKKIAVLTNGERLTMTDLLQQGITLAGTVQKQSKKKENLPGIEQVIRTVQMPRGKGIATLGLGKDQRVLWSSWTRKNP